MSIMLSGFTDDPQDKFARTLEKKFDAVKFERYLARVMEMNSKRVKPVTVHVYTNFHGDLQCGFDLYTGLISVAQISPTGHSLDLANWLTLKVKTSIRDAWEKNKPQ